MTNAESPSQHEDHTNLNRSTYDRIAVRYFEQQVKPHPSSDDLFSTFESDFIAMLPPGGVLADMGCGPALDGARLETLGFRVLGLDLSAGMLDVASQRLPGRVVQSDLRSIPLASHQLDGIWCVASLLHVPESDTTSVLREFKRVLRMSGVLALVTALGRGEEFEEVTYASDERRWFVYRDTDELLGQLRACGFTVTKHAEESGTRNWLVVIATAG